MRAAPGWGAAVTATTDYVVRGVSESSGDPAFQLDVHYGWPAGWYAGGFASSLGGNPGEPEAEYNLYAGHVWALGTTASLTAAAGRYWYAGSAGAGDYDYNEVSLALTYRDAVTGALYWLPDRKAYAAGRDADRGALSAEVSARLPLVAHTAISASGGYYDVHGLETSGYWFWSAGVEANVGALTLGLAWFGTDSAADDLFYYNQDAAGQRWAATASWKFP